MLKKEKKKRISLVVTILTIAYLIISANFQAITLAKTASIKSNASYSNKVVAKVLSNHDGDTITVSINGTKEKVRLLGIDTAEMQQGYWGEAAKKFTESFTKGKTVELETDIQKRDQYGRLLAYVYVSGKFLTRVCSTSYIQS